MNHNHSMYMEALVETSQTIRRLTNDNWGIIGSASLMVHDLIDYIPEDINVVVSDKDFRHICKNYGMDYPEKTFGDDNSLCSNRIVVNTDSGIQLDIAANLQYLTPMGVYETIDPGEFKTEYVASLGMCIWNVITPGTYMSLAGRFNREKDRMRLKTLHDRYTSVGQEAV